MSEIVPKIQQATTTWLNRANLSVEQMNIYVKKRVFWALSLRGVHTATNVIPQHLHLQGFAILMNCLPPSLRLNQMMTSPRT